MIIKTLIKRICLSMGYEIARISDDFGQNAYRDMRKLAKASARFVVIDAGANVGQSIVEFRSHFDQPVIHAFEPGFAFSELRRRSSGIPDLYLNNLALGSKTGEMDFIANEFSPMSSLLAPSFDCWGSIKETHKVTVKTLDDYCTEQGITNIDILKSDTQGFDLEV